MFYNQQYLEPPQLRPRLCFQNYVEKLEIGIEFLAKNLNGIHTWNAVKLYRRNANIDFIGDVGDYLNRCETFYGGKVKIFLKSLSEPDNLNNFNRPLPSTKFRVSFFEQKYSVNIDMNYFLHFSGKKFMRRSMCAASGPWYCSSKF